MFVGVMVSTFLYLIKMTSYSMACWPLHLVQTFDWRLGNLQHNYKRWQRSCSKNFKDISIDYISLCYGKFKNGGFHCESFCPCYLCLILSDFPSILNWKFNTTLMPSTVLGAFGILVPKYFLRFAGALSKHSSIFPYRIHPHAHHCH